MTMNYQLWIKSAAIMKWELLKAGGALQRLFRKPRQKQNNNAGETLATQDLVIKVKRQLDLQKFTLNKVQVEIIFVQNH